MANRFQELLTLDNRYGGYTVSEDHAFRLHPCPDCEGNQMNVVAMTRGGTVRWLWCVNCHIGLVENNGSVWPADLPLRIPAGVTGVELAAWREVRECLGAGANTAAVMMCRKLLLHIAVAHGLPPKNAKDRAPSYAEAVEHLEAEGIITKRMRPWVDRIKDIGNDANHEIVPITRETALDVATFTEQLLRLTYELDAMMAAPTTPDAR